MKLLFLLLVLVLSSYLLEARKTSKSRPKTGNSGNGGGGGSKKKNNDSGTSSSNSGSNSGYSYGAAPPASGNSYTSNDQSKSSAGNYQSYSNQKTADGKSTYSTTNTQNTRRQSSHIQQSRTPIGWNIQGPGPQKSKTNPVRDSKKSNSDTPLRSANKPSGRQNLGSTKHVNESPNVKKTAQNQQQQNSPIGWNIPGQQNSNAQRNPVWNTPNSKSNVPQNSANAPPSKGWASGYQNQGPKRDEGLVKKETSKVQQQSNPHQPQPPQPGWNVGGQNNAPHTNSGWKSGYQTQGAPPAYPHHNAAPPAYNGQTSWGAPPAYSGHAPGYGGYGGYGHGYQQPGGYGGYGGHGGYGGYHPQQSFGGYNPGYGGMGMGGGFGSVGGFGGGFGGSGFGGGGYPMQKKSFFSASTIGNVVAGMLVYNMASSLISHGLGLKRPYNVVNYYNQDPDKKVEEIKLPSNVLMLCDGNVNQMCQGTQPVCTQNGTVLCVATMNQASPCEQGGNPALCINTTVPCADANDPLCQNSTQKDKLQAEVNVPCFTNLTLDVNLVDKDQTLPNTKYTYCVTNMAIAGPEYKICDDLKNSNDYRSVLEKNYEWFLETDGFKRNYSIYTFDRPMESNGQISMPVTVLLKCTDDAKKLCPPGTIATCTSFNEIMCMTPVEELKECPERNATCTKSEIPCPEDSKESFCQNKTEGEDKISLDIPCFANITLNTPFPKFSLIEFNGTLPDLTVTSSYTYNFNYCVSTLALPGTDFDLCITKEAKEKRDKEQAKT